MWKKTWTNQGKDMERILGKNLEKCMRESMGKKETHEKTWKHINMGKKYAKTWKHIGKKHWNKHRNLIKHIW